MSRYYENLVTKVPDDDLTAKVLRWFSLFAGVGMLAYALMAA
jgi:hypothetical protein